MRALFMNVKNLFTERMGLTGAMVGLLILVSMTSACEPKHEQTDEIQSKVNEGNLSLERMEEIDKTLRSYDIVIKNPTLSIQILNRKSAKELGDIKLTIAEYIRHAESVMKIASRTDIRFGDKERIAEALDGANRLLTLIEVEMKHSTPPDRGRLTSGLWSDWRTCQSWSRENPSIYGIWMRHDVVAPTARSRDRDTGDSENRKVKLQRLGRERRLKINSLARRHLECLNVEIQMEESLEMQNVQRILDLQDIKAYLETLMTETTPSSAT